MYVYGRGTFSCHFMSCLKCHHVASMYMCHAMYVTVTHIHTFMYYSAHEHTFMHSTGNTVDMLHWQRSPVCGSVICFFHAHSFSRIALVKQIGRRQKSLPLLKWRGCIWCSMKSPLKDREQYTPSLLDWLGAPLLELLG